MSKAFPGVDGIKEYTFKEAINRLEILFDYPMETTSPLVIKENGNLYPINRFRKINGKQSIFTVLRVN